MHLKFLNVVVASNVSFAGLLRLHPASGVGPCQAERRDAQRPWPGPRVQAIVWDTECPSHSQRSPTHLTPLPRTEAEVLLLWRWQRALGMLSAAGLEFEECG